MAARGHMPGVKAAGSRGGILLLALLPGLALADLDAKPQEGATLRFVREGSLVREIDGKSLGRKLSGVETCERRGSLGDRARPRGKETLRGAEREEGEERILYFALSCRSH